MSPSSIHIKRDDSTPLVACTDLQFNVEANKLEFTVSRKRADYFCDFAVTGCLIYISGHMRGKLWQIAKLNEENWECL